MQPVSAEEYQREQARRRLMKQMDREVVDAMKRLQKGIPGVEQRVVPMVGDVEYSDEEEEGQEIFAMDAELDPKFLNHFSTDYAYEELTEEQKEIHDALFSEPDEEILVGDEGLADEQVELDRIIKEAKGGVQIKLPELSTKDKERRDHIEKKQKAFYEAQNLPETSEEKFFRDIIGKQKKIVRFEERSDQEDDDEDWDDEDEEEEGMDEPKPEEKTQGKENNPTAFTDEDFPPLSSLVPDDELDGDRKVQSPGEDDDEEDAKLEQKIRTEEEMEYQIGEVLNAEYSDKTAVTKETKLLSAKEFDSILDSHISNMKKPIDGRIPVVRPGAKPTEPQKSILKNKPAAPTEPKEPRVEVYTNSSGGQVTFYYGGSKPKESKKTGMVKTGVEKVLDKHEEAMKEECLRKAREMAAQQGSEIEAVEVEEVEDEEEMEDGDWEDEDDEDDDEEGEEEESEDSTNMNDEEKIEKYIRKYKMDRRLPLDMRIERDKKLPDMMNGLKVFKVSLLPDIPYSQDIAYQQSLAADKEEEIDFSKPPEDPRRSIREPIVEFPKRPHVLTKTEALGTATVIKETNVKRKGGNKRRDWKDKKDKKDKTKEVHEEEEESDDEQDQSVAQDPGLVRQKGETAEERKLRKELVKKMKEERKEKKKNFKEKYETLKKGFLTQNNVNANNGGTQGIPVYKIT